MITTSSGSVYKDCVSQDFVRYFQGTLMLWNLSQTKKRIFWVEELGGGNVVRGQYLTREKEWKPKEFKFSNWWENLDAIALSCRLFNMSTGAGYWTLPMQQNFKKSFNYNTSNVKFFGKIPSSEMVTQEIVHKAFGDIYGQAPLPPISSTILAAKAGSVATREGFILDPVGSKLYYRGMNIVGKLQKDGRILLGPTYKFLIRPLVDAGVPADLVMLDKEVKSS